ncbi:MAG: hypothetical protein IH802_12750 [Nitrospinae bacterium]|nr:hypothetical protein [Nitrospinota bacterium]
MSNVEKIADVPEVNQLIALGKEKGYLTYEEVNDVLPANLVAPDQIDDLMHLFGENEIDIVDSPTKDEKPNEEVDGKDSSSSGTSPTETKTESVTIDDPVRLYLREMGTISLLTREGEVEIAKRIEAGQNEVISAVANCSVTIREIVTIDGTLKKLEASIFTIINRGEPEEKTEAREKAEVKKFSKNVKNLVGQEKKLNKLHLRALSIKLSEKMRTKLEKETDTHHKKLEKMVRDLDLNNNVMDLIIEKIYEIAGQFREAGKAERLLEKELGRSLADVRKLAKNWKNQKSVKLPSSKVITKKQYDNHTKTVLSCRRKIRKVEKETSTSKDQLLSTVRTIARGRVKDKTAKRELAESVDEIVLPGHDGYLGVRPGHAPLLVRLQVGELSYNMNGKRHAMAISGGVLLPMGNPMGACRLAISAGVRSSAASRSRRLAAVRVEPMAPM